jgi:hypothetical protein
MDTCHISRFKNKKYSFRNLRLSGGLMDDLIFTTEVRLLFYVGSIHPGFFLLGLVS